MKPFWKKTVDVLKFICKLVAWLTGDSNKKDHTPDDK